MFDLSILGRFSFTHAEPVKGALPPGRHHLGISAERDAVLFVPGGLDEHTPVPLFVMFHGAGGFPEKVLPFIEEHAERDKFLILAPHSMYPTWDIVVGGSGPDLERLQEALTEVTSRYRIDRDHLAFAGFSDGASYALSIGVTNGDIASHGRILRRLHVDFHAGRRAEGVHRARPAGRATAHRDQRPRERHEAQGGRL